MVARTFLVTVAVAVAAVAVFSPPAVSPPPAAAPVAALEFGVLDPQHGRVTVDLVQPIVRGAHLGDRGLRMPRTPCGETGPEGGRWKVLWLVRRQSQQSQTNTAKRGSAGVVMSESLSPTHVGMTAEYTAGRRKQEQSQQGLDRTGENATKQKAGARGVDKQAGKGAPRAAISATAQTTTPAKPRTPHCPLLPRL